MNSPHKNTLLVFVLLLIVGSIWYIERQKPARFDPSLAADVVSTPITQIPAAASSSTTVAAKTVDRTLVLAQKAKEFQKAKELVDPTGFINTPAFKLSDYVGKKVILVDFWTYSCINCQRTLPYLNAWYQKYKDQGLVIVGVHTPEFDFEKNYDNVKSATTRLGINYPVVLDSNHGTWDAYQNEYWPREYLIDIDGYVVHDHIGEGEYDKTEQAIQQALAERDQVLGIPNTIDTSITNPSDTIAMDELKVGSPETYFGFARNEYLANGKQQTAGSQTLSLPTAFSPNSLYLGGTWNFASEYASNTSQTATIVFPYNAKNVYLVGSASSTPVTIKVLRDGVVPGVEAGADVKSDGTAVIKENRLYTLIQGATYGSHTIEIQVQGAGLDAYTFTFG